MSGIFGRCVLGGFALAAASFPAHRATAELREVEPAFVSPGVGSDDLVSIVGSYDVEGIHPEGTAYKGTGTVTRLGAQLYQMSWTTPQGTFHGLVHRRRDLLLGGWGYTQNQRAAVYRVDGTTLDGITMRTGTSSLGRELLNGGGADHTGTFTIANGVDPDGAIYSGTMEGFVVTKEVRRLEWHIGGQIRRGYGVQEGSDFIVGYDDTGRAGPVRYRIGAGGATIVGVFLDPQMPHLGLGTETMTRVD